MTAKSSSPKLGAAGLKLLAAFTGELGDTHEFDARERMLIETAARLADRLVELEALVAADGVMVTSPSGVVRIHPAVAELRLSTVALAKVLDTVKLPSESASGRSPLSLRKSRAAHARWDADWRRRDGGVG